MVLIAGVVGTVTAIWLYNNFVSWLNFLNATLPPIGAIIALDYFMHKERYKGEGDELININWGAIAGGCCRRTGGQLRLLGYYLHQCYGSGLPDLRAGRQTGIQ